MNLLAVLSPLAGSQIHIPNERMDMIDKRKEKKFFRGNNSDGLILQMSVIA